MPNTLATPPSSRQLGGLCAALCAAAVLLVLPSFSHALDARSEAEATIRALQADISNAVKEIGNLDNRILAGDVLIAANEVAIVEAQKQPDNQAAVITLQITLGVLKAKKNDLLREKQDWERFRRERQQSLAEWQAYLRQLGG